MLLPQILLLACAPQSVALTEAGERIPCLPTTEIGALQIESEFGIFVCPQDPVKQVLATDKEVTLLASMKQDEFASWAQRCSKRGLLRELAKALDSPPPQQSLDQQLLLFVLIEDWGRKLDPLPRKLNRKQRIEYAWKALEKTPPSIGALICGRLKIEIIGPNATPKERLSLADLRRGLRSKYAALQLAACKLSAHQLESDMFRPIAEQSMESRAPLMRSNCATSMLELNSQSALNVWTSELLRGKKSSQRKLAAKHLGNSQQAAAIEPLIVAVASAYRAPGRFTFFGRQISLVTDFDVEVAGAAAIANPNTSVLTEGMVLQVRIISTSVSRAAMRGLNKITGENPGEREEDWLEWWRRRKIGL